MQLQVFSLIKEKRATSLCQISSEHKHPAVMGTFVLHRFLQFTRGPCRKWCHLTLSPKHQKFLLTSSGMESSHLPSRQDWPPASRSNTPKTELGDWKGILSFFCLQLLTLKKTSVTLTGIPLTSLGSGVAQITAKFRLKIKDKELHQIRLLVKFWKKLNQHNLH